MKKVISLLLAAIFAFSVLAVSAAAAGTGGDYQTCYMHYDIRNDNLLIVPCEGYSQYVLPGEDFKFTVEAKEGFSTAFAIVEVDGVTLKPDIHDKYIISNIDSDKTIVVYVAVQSGQSNIFSSLIVLVHNVLEWFKEIFESLMHLAG